MLKLKLQYFDHLMQRAKILEKGLDAGKDGGQEKKGEKAEELALCLGTGWELCLHCPCAFSSDP